MPLPQFDYTQGSWRAKWIWHPDVSRDEFSVVRFRKKFDLPETLDEVKLWVSADERFILYLDGKRIARGPTRSDLSRWVATPVKLGKLASGSHVLSATVTHYGADQTGMGQMGHRAGFMVAADRQREDCQVFETNDSWRCVHDTSRTPIAAEWGEIWIYYCLGSGDQVDGSKVPWGCESLDYDDGAWSKAKPVQQAAPAGTRDAAGYHRLIPDPLPPMEESPQRFERVAEAEGFDAAAAAAFIEQDAPLTVEANTKVRLLLDMGVLTNAYNALTVSGGKGASIRVKNLEALYTPDKDKGNRDETMGKLAWGEVDAFFPDGRKDARFETLWWRSYRYHELVIETADAPLTLEKIESSFTGYPMVQRAKFQPDERAKPVYDRMWELSWRTARLCAHETYFDCPHYEQLQYIGDTRIQVIFSYLMTGDDRLARKSIDDFWASRIPEGLTQSRFPSRLPQIIPPFSLYWIGMLHDYRVYRGDLGYLRGYLDTARSVLSWFHERRRDDGLLGPMPFWNFCDWVSDWKHGQAPGAGTGGNTYLSLLFAEACKWMADLENFCGYPELAPHWQRWAEHAIKGAKEKCWVPERGLYADTPEKKDFSQHSNFQAVLAGAISGESAAKLVETAYAATDLTPPGSPYWRYYVAQVFKRVGRRELFFDLLKTWEVLLQGTGLTTWPEADKKSRSDCHAWSCTPSIEFFQTILGVEPAQDAVGFARVNVTPCLGPLKQAKGEMPTPHGPLKVALERQSEGLLVALDSPVPATLYGVGGEAEHELSAGQHRIVLKS